MNLNEFISKVKELGIELNDNQINQFNKYYELLVEYNKVMNLTGITEYEEVLEKHFYDSLTMANKVNLNNSTLVDIGAGAGFPCIPLKIAFPSLDVTVVDSLAKRMKFLEIVIKELNLENNTISDTATYTDTDGSVKTVNNINILANLNKNSKNTTKNSVKTDKNAKKSKANNNKKEFIKGEKVFRAGLSNKKGKKK